jgi:metallo-beta-lactamase family protein
MDLHFLGAATTVTGSQFLLETGQARILVDCGMFQGGPNEAIRNRIPLAFDPATLDAILLTHAHLDHCGLIPHVVREGFRGPIRATAGTIELARLVLLDSGRLQEEFSKREDRWERRHPDRAEADDAKEQAALDAAIELAEAGEHGTQPTSAAASFAARSHETVDDAPTSAPDATTPATRATPAATARIAPATPAAAASPLSAPASSAAPATPAAPGSIRHAQEAAHAEGAHVATSIEPVGGPGRPDHERDLRATAAELTPDLDAPLYTERDAVESLRGFRAVRYGVEEEVAPGIHATYLDAGHILGSAIIRLRVQDVPGGPERILVFSGDLGRTGAPIIADPTPMSDADYVLCESTYGGREHEPTAEAHRILAETVRLVAEHDGVLLVPSFAIGRTQEIVWELDRLVSAGEIPALPLYLDSPMASKASDIYRRHTEYFDEETRALFESGDTPLDYPKQIVVNDMAQSQAIARARRPYMIVASNGMLTGGRVVGHLRNLIDDPAATILFVGYQGEGTLGRHLQEGARTVRLDGQVRDVRCRIASISGFSAHADEPGLLAWLAGFAHGKAAGDPGFPRRVFLVHGDPGPQAELAPKVAALGFDVHVPRWHEVVTLD